MEEGTASGYSVGVGLVEEGAKGVVLAKGYVISAGEGINVCFFSQTRAATCLCLMGWSFFYEKGSVGSFSVVEGFVFVFSIWGLQVCL